MIRETTYFPSHQMAVAARNEFCSRWGYGYGGTATITFEADTGLYVVAASRFTTCD